MAEEDHDFEEYFRKMQEINEELANNGGAKLPYRSIHAGQALLYGMAADAKAKASVAKDKAEANYRWIRGITIVVFILVIAHAQLIPDVLRDLARLLGIP